MKVLFLAGGKGSRISEYTNKIPKPMIKIKGKPILEHIINIYAKQSFSEFFIATGYKGASINNYFKKYKIGKNLFKLRNVSKPVSIRFIYTGANTMTGGRLKKLGKYFQDDNFMFTYGDGLGNINLKKLHTFHKKYKRVATVTAVRPLSRYGILDINGNKVRSFKEKQKLDYGWINGGFFIFNRKIFNCIKDSQTVLEKEPLDYLSKKSQLYAIKHKGFWYSIDTVRDKKYLESLIKNNKLPWEKL